MEILMYIGVFTMWITPIIFIMSLIRIMEAIKEGEEHKGHTIMCAISFWLIIVPMFATIFLT